MAKFLIENNKRFSKDFQKLLEKRDSYDSEVDYIVNKILEDVKNRSDKALLEYTKKYDNNPVKSFKDLIIKKSEIDSALKKIDKKVISSLKHSIRRVTSYHKKQLPKMISTKINMEFYLEVFGTRLNLFVYMCLVEKQLIPLL